VPLHKSISDALDVEQEQLRIFELDRSIALRNLLALFEVEVADLYILDQTAPLIDEEPSTPFLSGRYKLEDALCRIIPTVWQKCPASGTYNTRFDPGSFDDAMNALKFQAKRNMVESLLEESGYGTVDCDVEGSSVRFKGIHGLNEVHDAMRMRNIDLERELEDRMISASLSAQRKPDHKPLDSWMAGLEVQMRMHGFEPMILLNGYRVRDYSLVRSALLAISNRSLKHNFHELRLSLLRKKVDPRTFVMIVREPALKRQVVDLTKLPEKVVGTVLRDLTYRGSDHPTSIFLWPLIPLGADVIALSPSFLSNVEPFRNLRQRLIIESGSVYQRIKDELAENVVAYLRGVLEDKGFRVQVDVPVLDSKGRVLTDIDLLAVRDGTILVLQVKNINPHDTPNERARAARDLKSAETQLELSMKYVFDNLESVLEKFALRPTTVKAGQKVRGAIISGVRPQVGFSVPTFDIIDIAQFESFLSNLTLPKPDASPSVNFHTGMGWCQVGEWRIETETKLPNDLGDKVVNFSDMLPIENLREYVTLA